MVIKELEGYNTVARAAERIEVNLVTLYRQIKRGKVDASLIGGVLFVPESEVCRLEQIEKLKKKGGKTVGE